MKKLLTVSVENLKVFPQPIKILRVNDHAYYEKYVEMLIQTYVKRVAKNKKLFKTVTETSTFYIKYIPISTGGTSYPQTG